MDTYLFDFDGTLVDSMPTFVGTMLQILQEYNIPYENDIVRIITPMGYTKTAEYFTALGVPLTRDEILEKMHEYAVRAYENTIPAKRNVIAVLRTLKERGASLNVLTASPHAMLDPCLKRLGIYDIFDHVWSCDDFCTTKANPEIYRRAARKMGTTVEKVLFLDDNYNANVTAKAAGMMTCGVYDESSADYVEEMKKATDRYIYNFTELL